MNPKVPDILSRVLAQAESTLKLPTGDPRRLDVIERLLDDVQTASEWPTDQPRRYVTDWTLMLMKMLRKLERSGPHGDAIEIKRARAVAQALLPHVQDDAFEAMRVRAAS